MSRRLFLWVFTVLCILAMAVSFGCNSSRSHSEQIKENPAKQISVRPMEDPDNPFKDQYRPWDYWLYTNLDTESTGNLKDITTKQRVSSTTFQYDSLITNVTEEGFLVPMEQGVREYEASVSDGSVRSYEAQRKWVCGYGSVEHDVFQDCFQACDRIRAGFYPEVPNWLVQGTIPASCILLSDDYIVTSNSVSGDKNSAHADEGENAAEPHEYFLYDGEGNELGHGCGHWWFLIYAHRYPDREVPVGEFTWLPGGIVEFRDSETDRPSSTWNWDATEIDSTATPPQNDRHWFQKLAPATVQQIFDFQNEANG